MTEQMLRQDQKDDAKKMTKGNQRKFISVYY